MTVFTKVSFAHPDMALAHSIETVPSLDLRVLPEAGTDPEHDMYFFLLESGDVERVRTALEADHTVADDYLTSEYGGQWVFGIRFKPGTVLLAPRVTEMGGMALEARTSDDGWIERWQLPDRDALHTIWEHAREESFSFDILELYRSDAPTFSETFGLTEEQRETLLAAYANGYFEEPRGITLEELADLQDISPSAASGRLRRGMGKLIETTFDRE